MGDQSSKCYLLFTSFLPAMVLRTPPVPDRCIQPDEMEDILYDYHTVDAMYQLNDGEPITMIAYKTAVLKKNDVLGAELDSSVVYYTKHTGLLRKIYESLSIRLNKEALVLETSASEANQYSSNSADKDTADMWTGE